MAEETTTVPEETKTEPAADVVASAKAGPDKPADAEAPKKAPKRKKAKRSVPSGQVHVQASFNNTIITFTDSSGNVLATSSAGACGFRGSKKGTAYAAQVAAERAAQTAKQQYGFSKADVMIKGIGFGRDAAVRVLAGIE